MGDHDRNLWSNVKSALQTYLNLGEKVPDLDQLTKEHMSTPDQIANWLSKRIGSWVFVGLEVAVGVVWVGLHQLGVWTFDKSPFSLFAFVLAFVAAVATPLILISQNRQASTDRLAADAARHYALLAVAAIEQGVLPKLNELTAEVKKIQTR